MIPAWVTSCSASVLRIAYSLGFCWRLSSRLNVACRTASAGTDRLVSAITTSDAVIALCLLAISLGLFDLSRRKRLSVSFWFVLGVNFFCVAIALSVGAEEYARLHSVYRLYVGLKVATAVLCSCVAVYFFLTASTFTEVLTEAQKAVWLEEKFVDLLEASPEPLVVVNRAGKIIFFNSHACDVFEYDRFEISGMQLDSLAPNLLRGMQIGDSYEFLNKPCRRQLGPAGTLFGQTKSGRQFPIELSINPLKAGEGSWTSVSIRDISEGISLQENLAASEKRFCLLVDGARDYAIFGLDADGKVASWNAGAERIKGY